MGVKLSVLEERIEEVRRGDEMLVGLSLDVAEALFSSITHLEATIKVWEARWAEVDEDDASQHWPEWLPGIEKSHPLPEPPK